MVAVKMNQSDEEFKEQIMQWVQPGAMEEHFSPKVTVGYLENARIGHEQAILGNLNKNITIDKLIEYIRTGVNRFDKSYHDEMRKFALDDTESYSKKKKALPCVSLCGELYGRHVKKLSGLYQVDFDTKENINEKLKDNTTLLKLKDLIGNDPFTVFCAISPSGQGLKAAVRINPQYIAVGLETGSVKEYVDKLWRCLYEYFYSKYELEIDKGVKDIHKLCFVPYDPDVVVNYQAKIFEAPTLSDSNEVKPAATKPNPHLKYRESQPHTNNNSNNQLYSKFRDLYNSQYDWEQLFLFPMGYHSPKIQAKGIDYTRKGVNDHICGTLYIDKSPILFHCFSSEAGLTAGKTYNLNDAILEGILGGDKKAIEQYMREKINERETEWKSSSTGIDNIKKDVKEFPYVFWYKEEVSGRGGKKNSKLLINEKIVYDYLSSKGFCQIQWWGWKSKQVALVKIVNNICEKVEIKRLRTSLSYYVNKLPMNILDEFTRDDLLNALGKIYPRLIIEEKIDLYMPLKEVEFVHSINRKKIEKTINYYFQNCWVEVTKDSINSKDYKDLDGVIWKHSLINSNFVNQCSHQEVNISEMSYLRRFFEYQCTDPLTGSSDLDLYARLQWTVGYSMDQRREKDVNYIPFITEANTDINIRNGGTGKGIIVQIIEFYRSTLTVNWDKDNKFVLSELEPWTDVVAIQEIPQGFDFDYQLFSAATDGLKVERKFKPLISVPSDETPKFICNSNYPANTAGGSSSDRRLLEVELKTFFNNIRTPKNVLGTILMDNNGGWSQEDWDLAHSTIFYISQNYLNSPKPPEHKGNITKSRRTLYNTMEGFPEWADSYFMEEDGTLKDKKFQIGDLIMDFATEINLLPASIKLNQMSSYLTVWMQEKNLIKVSTTHTLNDYASERKKCFILKKLIL